MTDSLILGDVPPSGQPMSQTSQPERIDPVGVDVAQQEAAGRENNQDEVIRKLQSEKDKSVAAFNKLEQETSQATQFFNAFQQNPDLIPVVEKAVREYAQGPTELQEQSTTAGFNPEVDFDPQEAFTPGTKSFDYRVKQEDARVQKIVNEAVGAIRTENQTDQAREKLVQRGLSSSEAAGWTDFLANPQAYPNAQELLMGPLADAFAIAQRGDTNPTEGAVGKTEADKVLAAQGTFPTGGNIPGMQIAPRSEVDQVWDKIIDSAQQTTILK